MISCLEPMKVTLIDEPSDIRMIQQWHWVTPEAREFEGVTLPRGIHSAEYLWFTEYQKEWGGKWEDIEFMADRT